MDNHWNGYGVWPQLLWIVEIIVHRHLLQKAAELYTFCYTIDTYSTWKWDIQWKTDPSLFGFKSLW